MQNACCIKTGTGFHPFFGFYLAVMVQVGAEVAMTTKPGAGIIPQEQHHEHTERMSLKSSAGIGRPTMLVQPAFITNTDTVCIVPVGMGTRLFYRAEGFYSTIAADIKMITCTGEAPAQVVCRQVVFRQVDFVAIILTF